MNCQFEMFRERKEMEMYETLGRLEVFSFFLIWYFLVALSIVWVFCLQFFNMPPFKNEQLDIRIDRPLFNV